MGLDGAQRLDGPPPAPPQRWPSLSLHSRQHSTVTLTCPGNMELLWQIGLNMHLDPATLDTREGFQEFLYLTQV